MQHNSLFLLDYMVIVQKSYNLTSILYFYCSNALLGNFFTELSTEIVDKDSVFTKVNKVALQALQSAQVNVLSVPLEIVCLVGPGV